MSNVNLHYLWQALFVTLVLTLGQARPILWPYASNVPFSTASTDDIAAFDATLNRLCERLILEGKWRGCFSKVTLNTHGSLLTLPRNLASCLGVDPLSSDSNQCGFPLNIYSRWHEWAVNGLGLTSASINSCLIRGVVPVSDQAQTFVDPVGTFLLRAKSTAPSAGLTLIGGADENGAAIAGHTHLSVLNGTTTTTQQFTVMPFIEKAISQQYVELYSVDILSSVETLLCVYAPSETVPAYKRYSIPNAADGDGFVCLCKIAFVPMIVDSDLVIPPVMDALILGLMSFQYRDKNDPERSALYMGPNNPERASELGRSVPISGCLDVLNSDRNEMDAGERPVFEVSRQYGAGNIRSVR